MSGPNAPAPAAAKDGGGTKTAKEKEATNEDMPYYVIVEGWEVETRSTGCPTIFQSAAENLNAKIAKMVAKGYEVHGGPCSTDGRAGLRYSVLMKPKPAPRMPS
jgi:hypothetical protein